MECEVTLTRLINQLNTAITDIPSDERHAFNHLGFIPMPIYKLLHLISLITVFLQRNENENAREQITGGAQVQ